MNVKHFNFVKPYGIDLCSGVRTDRKLDETKLSEFFEKVKGDSESVAGMLMEIAGRIPQLNETIIYQNFSFIVEAVDNRRIKRIKVVIK